MNVENGLLPHHGVSGELRASAVDRPFLAISLLKFKPRAEYPEEPDCSLTGAEAYAHYAAGVGDCLAAVGARLVYLGDVAGIDVGEVEDPWDMAAVVEYPSLAAVQAVLRLPQYRPLIRHRTAGLAGQLALRVNLPHALDASYPSNGVRPAREDISV